MDPQVGTSRAGRRCRPNAGHQQHRATQRHVELAHPHVLVRAAVLAAAPGADVAMGAGCCPHTIRIDAKDRVWFTLALSNQVAMFDRATERFALHDLPTRSWREWLTVRLIRPIFKLMSWGVPLANWLPVDRLATGTPLPVAV